MASKKKPAPRWMVIFEEIRLQGRATLEAVATMHETLEQRIDRLDEESRLRDASLALAIRDLTVEVQQATAEIRDLTRTPSSVRLI